MFMVFLKLFFGVMLFVLIVFIGVVSDYGKFDSYFEDVLVKVEVELLEENEGSIKVMGKNRELQENVEEEMVWKENYKKN